MIKLSNQIKIAKTRLDASITEKNPTEKEVWKSILETLIKLEKIEEIIKKG